MSPSAKSPCAKDPRLNTDLHAQLQSRVEQLAQNGGTLVLADGVHLISRPLVLPWNVSLRLECNAVLKATPDFVGEAVVIKGRDGEPKVHRCFGQIRGGTIDASKHAITGIRVECACRLHIGDIEVVDARSKGIHVGVTGWYECNISNVRVSLAMDTRSEPNSIGVHYDKCTDSLVNSLVVIGYETGLRSDSSSNDFHQVHVWNVPAQGPLKSCFYCGGWNDSYNQCYADSPFDGENECYGFFVAKPFNRITAARIYCNRYSADARTVGIFLDAGGTHGTFMSNHFTCSETNRIKAAFAGNFDSACILGNSYGHAVMGGLYSIIPSGSGGLSRMPASEVVGDKPLTHRVV